VSPLEQLGSRPSAPQGVDEGPTQRTCPEESVPSTSFESQRRSSTSPGSMQRSRSEPSKTTRSPVLQLDESERPRCWASAVEVVWDAPVARVAPARAPRTRRAEASVMRMRPGRTLLTDDSARGDPAPILNGRAPIDSAPSRGGFVRCPLWRFSRWWNRFWRTNARSDLVIIGSTTAGWDESGPEVVSGTWRR